MNEPMAIHVEAWHFAADDAGIWLLGPDALRSDTYVSADGDPNSETMLLLAMNGITHDTGLMEIHGTSCRVEGPRQYDTYYAAVATTGPVLEEWPDAQPIHYELAVAVGRAPSHGPLSLPEPRYVDVMFHALRHLRFRLDHDEDAAAVFEPYPQWRHHLAPLAPALYRMYGRVDLGASEAA